jgi:hypothetical protein
MSSETPLPWCSMELNKVDKRIPETASSSPETANLPNEILKGRWLVKWLFQLSA